MKINLTLLIASWRRLADSPLRIILVGLFVFFGYLFASGVGQMNINGQQMAGTLYWPAINIFGNALVWALGAGIIRDDARSGVITLVLLRPLSRAEFVLTRWVSLAGLSGAVVMALAVLAGAKAGSLGNLAFWGTVGASVLLVLAASAVVTFISCVPLGFGDLGWALLALLASGILALMSIGESGSSEGWLSRAILLALFPQFPMHMQDRGFDPEFIGALLRNLIILSAALTGAVAVFARREFAYGEQN